MKPWPKISKDGNKWLVDTNRRLGPGNRQRRWFNTRDEAETCAEEFRKLLSGAAIRSELTTLQSADALTALAVLAEAHLKSVRLTTTATFYAQHHQITEATLNDVFNAWEDRMKANTQSKENPHGKLRKKYTANLRSGCTQLLMRFGERPMATITAVELDNFFDTVEPLRTVTGTLSPGSRNFIYRYARMLWTFAKQKKHISIQPFDELKAPEVPEAFPQILTIAEVERLVKTAQDPQWQHFLPYVTLALFCGIRSEELSKLHWKDIDMTEQVVKVSRFVSKKSRSRSVGIPENAMDLLNPSFGSVGVDWFVVQMPWQGPQNKWMTEHRRKDGMTNFWHRWLDFTTAAGFKTWPRNCMRHSFASYLYKVSGNDTLLVQDRMGHQQRSTMFGHYLQETPDRTKCLDYFLIGADAKLRPLIHPYVDWLNPAKTDWPQVMKLLNLSR